VLNVKNTPLIRRQNNLCHVLVSKVRPFSKTRYTNGNSFPAAGPACYWQHTCLHTAKTGIVKNWLWIGLVAVLLSCNNTGTTAQPNDLDHTDVNDSTSPGSNLPWRDSLHQTRDTVALDSLKPRKK
jgi:hypothetical protein